jgi:hypothetical protein
MLRESATSLMGALPLIVRDRKLIRRSTACG